jgi:aspartate kinase
MRSNPGVAAKMFETLAQIGVNIAMISTSEIKVSVAIDLAKGEDAMRAVHQAFLG